MAKKQKKNPLTDKPAKPTAARKPRVVVSKPAKPAASAQSSSIKNLKASLDDPNQSFIVSGVVFTLAGLTAAGLTVVAFDQDVGGEDRLGEAIIDKVGAYEIKYTSGQFRRSKNESRNADIFVRVHGARNEMLFQSKVVRNAPAQLQLDVKLPAGQLVVRGRVTGAGQGQRVLAYDKDLRSEEKLGEAFTDSDGKYEIHYSPDQFKLAEKANADLWVVATDPEGKELSSSEIFFNAADDQTIDLEITDRAKGRSEFEHMLMELEPVLAGVALTDLDEKDITFLAGDTGIAREQIAWLAQAAKLSRQTISIVDTIRVAVIPSQKEKIPTEAFYGWFRLGLPTGWEELQRQRISALRQALFSAIDQNIIPAKFAEVIEAVLIRIPNPEQSELINVLGSSALSPVKIRAVLAGADGLDAISDEGLADLVRQKTLEEPEARLVGLRVSLHQLTGGAQALVSAMLEENFPSVTAGKLASARDLASLDPADWENVIDKSGASLPEGVSLAEHARSLAMQAVKAFPHAAFVQRATRVPEGVSDTFNAIKPLLIKNPNALREDFDALDLDGIDQRDLEALRGAHGDLKRFSNLHPGLDLPEAFSKANGARKAVAIVNERMGWLRTVFDLNQGVDFLNLDYLPDSVELRTVKFGDLSEEARGGVMRELKANQRIYAVANNAIPAREIMQAGYHSASAIAVTSISDFKIKTGLSEDETLDYHAVAVEVGNEAAGNWFRLYDLARDQATTPVRAIPSRNEFFKSLNGFQDLINNQAWCECAHCQSVLSPAAYFVDLMNYIEENILNASFTGKETHPLHLHVRRPDLWKLELSCKNTDEYVPYLDLVNEILESYLKSTLSPANASDLYQYLAGESGSFKQPFTLPTERIDILLEHFGLSRFEIAKAMGESGNIQARARLRISKIEYDLITQERTSVGDLAFFIRLFKIATPLTVTGADTPINPLAVQVFLNATGFSHEIVESILKSKFVNDDGSANSAVEIVVGKSAPTDIQNNSELVRNLTLKRLDRIHRFVRLWRTLPWTIKELDHVLTRLASPAHVSRIDHSGTVEAIVRLLNVSTEWSIPMDELMALSDSFSSKGLRDTTPLFDRLFNQAPFLNRDGQWPPQTGILFVHPAWKKISPAGVSDPSNNTLTRLLAGLQIGDKDLVELIEGLSAIPTLNHRPPTTTPVADESITLSAESIGVLYRHARLMRLLKLGVTDFLKLIRLTPRKTTRPLDAARYINDLDDVISVIEFSAWQKSSGFSLDEIFTIIGAGTPTGTPDSTTLATGLVAVVQEEKHLEFADTVLTQIGLTDIQSRKIVLDNLSTVATDTKAFEAVPESASYRLKKKFNPATSVLVIADSSINPPVDAAVLQELLGRYYALRVLDVALGTTLSLSPGEANELRNLAHPLGIADVPLIAVALQGGDKTILTALLADTLRYRALFKSDVFLLINPVSKVSGLGFVQSNRSIFGLPADPTDSTLNPQAIRNVAAYVAFTSGSDPGFTTASAPIDLDAIQTVLLGLGTLSQGGLEESLAKTLRTDKTRIGALKPHLIALPANPFAALTILARCLVFTEAMGVSGETLSLMIKEVLTAAGAFDAAATFKGLSRAAEDVFGSFRAKYPDAKIFQEKIEPFEDKLRSRKRDGLVDYVVSKWPVPFSDPNKLYEYFLIDVLLEGCARTSRVVAAISSLQLYVHRVLMNLEWSNDWNGDPTAKGVYARFADPDKQAEWYWRENYRVWEANRKVFLYPENYIEPELRDDKTPLFKELEGTLLQQEINDANVEDAYGKYLIGFSEVASLKIAGSYYDVGNYADRRDDTLHLFGVTRDAPPVYYYRVVKGTLTATPTVSSWEKITLHIPVPKVSALAFEGRLHLFWLETSTRVQSVFSSGTSEFKGYRHAVRIKYSTLRADGKWATVQSLSFADGKENIESRVINDPATATEPALKADTDAAQNRVTDLARIQGNASNEAARTAGLVGEAVLALNVRLTPAQIVETAAVQAAVALAGSLAFGAALFGGPAAAAAASLAASLGVMVASVPGSSVKRLQDAGVNVWDPFIIAQRKVALMDARFIARIAADALQAATTSLNFAQADLERLQALVNVVTVRWDRSGRNHVEPLDNYKPQGWEWDRVYPSVYTPPASSTEEASIRLTLVPRNDPDPLVPPLTCYEVDFSTGVLHQRPATDDRINSRSTDFNNVDGTIRQHLAICTTYVGQEYYLANYWLNFRNPSEPPVAQTSANADLQVVNGSPNSIIVESQTDRVWIRTNGPGNVIGTRLGTTLTPDLNRRFSHGGPSSLLQEEFQRELSELPPKIQSVGGRTRLSIPETPFDLTNPYLTYFRETFFHIPFLVANHLNRQQKFAETQRWYHHIFNPTASGNPWRYREFQNQPNPSLRQLLLDPAGLNAYRADPFNPHAIARTRLSAYQKSIVMKYIDNLLDWGDSLFGQFTMESVNEATMLYVMAQELLGPKPPELGACGGKNTPLNYETIKQRVLHGTINDFLIELEPLPPAIGVHLRKDEETKLVIKTGKTNRRAKAGTPKLLGLTRSLPVGEPTVGAPMTHPDQTTATQFQQLGEKYWTNVSGTKLSEIYGTSARDRSGPTLLGTDSGMPPISGNRTGNIDFVNTSAGGLSGQFGARDGEKIKTFDQIPPLDIKYTSRDIPIRDVIIPGRNTRPPKHPRPIDLVPAKDAVFCIPSNKDLRAYWGRVDDRLFKIRNCLNIDGVRRDLDLFSPEIDPRLLVRMKAAGLTLEDVLNSIAGNVPPYRFTYLIDKAKQYAGTLQNFGSQLLSALEKRDGEELAQLRAVHEQNLLKLRSRMVQMEIDAAEDALEGLQRQKAALQYRQDYFRSISDAGLLAPEHTQQERQHEASNYRTLAGLSQSIAAVLSIIPDVGAFTAMKFGGSQLGAAGRSLAEGLNAIASYNEAAASMAGMQASNQRREQEWKHQAEIAKREIAQLEKQIDAAEIRRDIALRSLEVHQTTIDQSEEVFEFFRDKFSSYDRYTLLSKRLRELYRMAFNSALSMARMTEQAFTAERAEDGARLSGNYWDADNLGLLAGERLLNDLQGLEQQYIEKNYRQLEVEQSFSLVQFSPELLLDLRLTGVCEFSIPEWFFDLVYPGQYRRRLKAVRLTLPCVTGPYANVGATLRLNNSSIRLKPSEAPGVVPLRHTVAIATSKAQFDSGVFDFSFRDERYMPFEGAGAISTWELSLPKTIRVFDYGTISDVIVHLDYTADFDGNHRNNVEADAGTLLTKLRTPNSLHRALSLRQEFPEVFHRLVSSPLETEIDFTVEQRHFQFFLAGHTLRADSATLHVITPLGSLAPHTSNTGVISPGTTFAFRELDEPEPKQGFRNLTTSTAAADVIIGQGLRMFNFGEMLKPLPTITVAPSLVGVYLIKLTAAGPLATEAPAVGSAPIDLTKLRDIIFAVSYHLE